MTTKSNERLEALQLLTRLIEERIPLSQLMQQKKSLSPLTKDLCFGVCRHYIHLEAIANALVNKKPKQTIIWLCLLISLYQIHYLRIPDYAAVKEGVDLLEQTKQGWAKGFVNGVLRAYCRQKEKNPANDAYHENHPTWLIERLKTAWPEDWQNILKANDTHAPMTLRVNQQLTNSKDYQAMLMQQGLEATPLDYAAFGLHLKKPCSVDSLPNFTQGFVSVQDEAPQLAASLLQLKPGLRVLDACCAPGGKTCHLLETEPELTACIALDIDQKRLTRVKENLQRLQLSANIIQGDALKPDTWWDGKHFDRILLDAPCSATGVIRRHPDIKLLRTPEEVAAVSVLQQAMLESLWPLLATGGILLYATCSILPEENEAQIAHFLQSHPDCSFSQKKPIWGRATGHGWQILPGDSNMDGFFYSVLEKKHEASCS